MRRGLLLLLGVGVPVMLCAQSSGRESAIVLNHVSVVDVAQSVVRPDMAIVIRGTRIVAIDRANAPGIPRDAQVIDLAGKFALPGLVDMHNHVGSGANIPGPPAAGQPAAERDPRRELKRLLALGFTTVFATAYPNVGEFAQLRKEANDNSAPLPHFFGAARGSTVAGGHSSRPAFNAFMPNTTEQARADVREMKALGVDAIKVTYSDQAHTGRALPVMRPELMQAIIDEAHSLGLKAYVHAPTLTHAKEVLRAGADGLAHSVADAPVDDEFIGLMRKNRATYTTTLALYTSFTDVSAWMRRLEAIDHHHVVGPDVYERYKAPAGAKAYHAFFGTFPPQNLQHARANARRISEAGIPVLAGTDTGVTGVLLGVSSQMELMLLVEAGLTPAEALRAATVNPARALGRDMDVGTLEPGKLADLVILDRNPLSDIRNIVTVHRVIKGGNIYEPAQLIAAAR